MPRAHRCEQPGCGGQLFLDPDYGGAVFELRCLLCARSVGTVTALDLVEGHGIAWRQVERAGYSAASFLWYADGRKPAHVA